MEFQASLDRFIFISKVHQKLYVQEKAKLSCQTWRFSVGSPKSLLLVFATINTGVSVLYIHKNCEVITFVYIYIVDFFSPQKNNYFPPPCFSHRSYRFQLSAVFGTQSTPVFPKERVTKAATMWRLTCSSKLSPLCAIIRGFLSGVCLCARNMPLRVSTLGSCIHSKYSTFAASIPKNTTAKHKIWPIAQRRKSSNTKWDIHPAIWIPISNFLFPVYHRFSSDRQ